MDDGAGKSGRAGLKPLCLSHSALVTRVAFVVLRVHCVCCDDDFCDEPKTDCLEELFTRRVEGLLERGKPWQAARFLIFQCI